MYLEIDAREMPILSREFIKWKEFHISSKPWYDKKNLADSISPCLLSLLSLISCSQFRHETWVDVMWYDGIYTLYAFLWWNPITVGCHWFMLLHENCSIYVFWFATKSLCWFLDITYVWCKIVLWNFKDSHARLRFFKDFLNLSTWLYHIYTYHIYIYI